MTAPELKPCPFCGGDEIGNTGKHAVAYVCMSCGGSGSFAVGDSEEPEVWAEALAAWNTRTTPPDVADLVEALRAMTARFEIYGGPNGMHFGHHDEALVKQARAALAKWEGR